MPKYQPLKPGHQFGRLTVIGLDHTKKQPRKNGVTETLEYYRCKCSCGNEVVVRKNLLRAKKNATKSCGCISREKAGLWCKENKTTHGLSKSRLYHVWSEMKRRCFNKNDIAYQIYYGSRGITVCDEWKNSFENFCEWAMSNGYRDDLTIDRIDNNGIYEPNNCRWVTLSTNCRNRRSCRYITYLGMTKCFSDWADFFGITYSALKHRVDRNRGIDKDFIWAAKK